MWFWSSWIFLQLDSAKQDTYTRLHFLLLESEVSDNLTSWTQQLKEHTVLYFLKKFPFCKFIYLRGYSSLLLLVEYESVGVESNACWSYSLETLFTLVSFFLLLPGKLQKKNVFLNPCFHMLCISWILNCWSYGSPELYQAQFAEFVLLLLALSQLPNGALCAILDFANDQNSIGDIEFETFWVE